ncbi:MAG: hypothetical protein RBT11_14085 [Desulfobacterales bacterium]|jgi:hypothetical protein|nr:hypothetical protein [Desulfobacterales bacterium]
MVNRFTNINTFRALLTEGRPFPETVKYLLACEGHDVTKVAKQTHLSLAAVSLTIHGKRKIRDAYDKICNILEFDPWATAREMGIYQ